MDVSALTLIEARKLILDRQISPVELTQAILERIEKIDPLLNSFITVTSELALEQAHQAQAVLDDGNSRDLLNEKPLLGIPLALKDLFETRGILTTGGSTFFKESIPETDAPVVDRIKQAGAVLVGKTNMHEIALGVTNANPHFGAVHNPWDLSRVPGGSSGGSAAALAAGLCLGSLGSDSGGSIRIPASLCGIVGLKPTYGRVSLQGVIPLSWNTDHAGPMGRSVEDVAVLLQCIAGYNPQDPYSIDLPVPDTLSNLSEGIQGWRLVLAAGDYFDRTDPQVWQAVRTAAQVMQELGATVEERPLKGLYEAAQANLLMVTSDAAAYHRERLQGQPEGFGADVLQRLRSGAAYSSSDYIMARRTQALLRRQFENFFENVDILMLPATPVAAPPIEGPDAVEQARLLTRYTAPFNLTGLPALSLPCGFTSQNLPVGLQLVARPWAETRLLRAAYAYEQATEWHLRKPALAQAE